MRHKSLFTYSVYYPWVRTLIAFIIITVIVCFMIVIPPALILVYWAFSLLLGCLNLEKVEAVFSHEFTGSDGQKYSYTVFKKTYTAYCPILLIRYMGIYNYIPYSREYYLVEGTGLLTPGTVVNDQLMSCGLRNYRHISRTKARSYRKNPQSAEELVFNSCSQANAKQDAALDSLENSGFIQNIRRHFSITACDFSDDVSFLVAYNRENQSLVGLPIENKAFITELLNTENGSIASLLTDNTAVYISDHFILMNEEWKKALSQGESSVNAAKKELTAEIVNKRMNKALSRSLSGTILFWFFFGYLIPALTILSFLSGMLPLGLIGLAFLGFVYYLYFKINKSSKASKKEFAKSGFKIYLCHLDHVDEEHDEDTGTKYKYFLDNGNQFIPTKEDFSRDFDIGMQYYDVAGATGENSVKHLYFSCNVWRLSEELKGYVVTPQTEN